MKMIVLIIDGEQDYQVTQECVEDGEVLAPVVTRPLRVHHRDGQTEQEVHRNLDIDSVDTVQSVPKKCRFLEK